MLLQIKCGSHVIHKIRVYHVKTVVCSVFKCFFNQDCRALDMIWTSVKSHTIFEYSKIDKTMVNTVFRLSKKDCYSFYYLHPSCNCTYDFFVWNICEIFKMLVHSKVNNLKITDIRTIFQCVILCEKHVSMNCNVVHVSISEYLWYFINENNAEALERYLGKQLKWN